MRSARTLLSALALSSCYFGADSYARSDETQLDASSPGPAGSSMDASLDALVSQPADASDGGPPDAGCQRDEACPASAPLCRMGECVACTRAQECTRFADTPTCGPVGACVECTEEAPSRCTGATPLCDDTTNRCVQCIEDADCRSDQAARCQADRTCGRCVEDADCAHLGKVCEAVTGSCVACRPESEELDCRMDKTCTGDGCAGTACNPKTLTCTDRLRGSVAGCEPCASDSECVADHACVEMTFGAAGAQQPLGGFCLQLGGTGCGRPYGRTIMRGSMNSSVIRTFCGIDEERVSCPAVRRHTLLETCEGTDESCGALGARCETVGILVNTCTYSCRSNADCMVDYPCAGDAADSYCGAAP